MTRSVTTKPNVRSRKKSTTQKKYTVDDLAYDVDVILFGTQKADRMRKQRRKEACKG